MNTSNAPRTPVSVVCVFNDPDVLESCLTRSVDAGLAEAPQTELIAIDNRGNPFTTAGAALNHGARQARNEVVVFVHQDVVLHSLPALERAAALLMDDHGIGMIGAVGIDHRRTIVGRMRDRVVQIGEPAPTPRDVDSLDEVLIMMRRDQILDQPLSEDPLLAWHAYGVEYACRVRRAGMRATALDLAITHNSLTINLDRLDVAHRKVGDDYPELLPIRTTCGTVFRGDGPGGVSRTLRRARGAAIWWGESVEARAMQRIDGGPVVLADIRLIIDDAVSLAGKSALRVIDVASTGSSVDGLRRFGHDFAVESVDVAKARERAIATPADEVTLITGLERDDVAALALGDDVPHIVGHWRDTGSWVLVGVDRDVVAPLWSETRNRPFAGVLGGA